MRRRSFLASLGGICLARAARAAPGLAANPFALGVASGRPRPGSIVLWTRLIADGGPEERLVGPVPVSWTIAEDATMQRIAGSGETIAEARWAHSVHVEVQGLKPNRPYWYRFTVQGTPSPVGRTRTAPGDRRAVDAAQPRIRLLPAVRAGLLQRLQAHGGRGCRLRRASRRLHLRDVLGARPGAPPRRRPHHHARRIPQSLRALQIRRRSASRARGLPVDRHLGRPRGRRRLHQRYFAAGARSRPLPRPARRRLPGLLGAHAAARLDAAARAVDARLRSLPLRRPRRVPSARRPPVSRPSCLPRGDAAQQGDGDLRGAARSPPHHARGRAGGVAGRRAAPGRDALERHRPADA